MSDLQSAMSMPDVEFQRQLDLYSHGRKRLDTVHSNGLSCISCKSAVFFIRWFLDNSYRTHPEINALKHDLTKFIKKIPKRKLSRSMRIELAYRQEYKCRTCAILLPPDFEVDHIRALEDGGEDVASNLQCLCVPCHKTKTRLNRLRKTRQFAEEAEVQHEEYTKLFASEPVEPPVSEAAGLPPEQIFSKYFSQSHS